jgi:uncharacterized damage-inducible protein DinB
MTSWTAPEVIRIDEPFTGDERATLDGFLEWYRATLLFKCQGLTAEQLAARAVPPSPISLIGLVRHLTEVEQGWLRRGVGGESVTAPYSSESAPDGDFEGASAASAEADYAAFVSELELTRAIVAGHGLDEIIHRKNRSMSVRWVYVHLIEEYARHAGHADFLRERIDGVIGS